MSNHDINQQLTTFYLIYYNYLSVGRHETECNMFSLQEKFAGVDIRVRVSGGGHVSQIYAIRQAISKALVSYYQKCKLKLWIFVSTQNNFPFYQNWNSLLDAGFDD